MTACLRAWKKWMFRYLFHEWCTTKAQPFNSMLTTGEQSGSIQSTTMEKRNKTKKQKGEKEKGKNGLLSTPSFIGKVKNTLWKRQHLLCLSFKILPRKEKVLGESPQDFIFRMPADMRREPFWQVLRSSAVRAAASRKNQLPPAGRM